MLSVRHYSFALSVVATAVTSGFSDAMPSGDYFAAMLVRVNQERAKHGVPPLCLNKKLQDAAQCHSDDMAQNSYMSHEGTDGSTVSKRIVDAGYEWEAVAENVAAGQFDVESVMQVWIKSPHHLENILNPDYNMLGIAFSYNKNSELEIYWTQNFGSSTTESCDNNTNTQPPSPSAPLPTLEPASPSAPLPASQSTPEPTSSLAPNHSFPLTPVAPTSSAPEPSSPSAPEPIPTTTSAPVVTPAPSRPTPDTTTSTAPKDCESKF